MRKDGKNGAISRILPLLVAVGFWLGVWWGLAVAVGQELLIPHPVVVGRKLLCLAQDMGYWQSVGVSLGRIFGGFVVGVGVGTLAAVASCRWGVVGWILAPAIRVIRATPVASFIILVLLWVHTGAVPGVISALMVLPIIWESVSGGIQSVDRQLLEMAESYEMRAVDIVRYVYWPAVRPVFTAGICTSVGLAWKSGVAAEVLCLPKAAIGSEVYFAKIYLETPSLFAWTITVVVLSLLLERIVRRLLLRQGGAACQRK